MVLAAGTYATPVLIAILGGGGITGAIVALVKIRPDISSASVTQAQGAMEVMQDLQDELRKALTEEREQTEYWRKRYQAERDLRRSIESEWGPFPAKVVDDDRST